MRDSIIWSLIVGDHQQQVQHLLPKELVFNDDNKEFLKQHFDWKMIVQGWTKTPLVEVHNEIYTTFHSFVLDTFEEELVREMEQAVCKEEAEMVEKQKQQQNGRIAATTAATKKRSNKKKKNKRRISKLKVTEGIKPLPVIPATSDEDDSDHDDYDYLDEETQATNGKHHNQSLAFPNNETSSVDRNRNIIMVLGILENIVEDVFVKVGLPRTPAFVEDKKAPGTTKSRSSENTILIRKKKNPVKKSNSFSKLKPTAPFETKSNGTNADTQRGKPQIQPAAEPHNQTIPRPMSFDLESSEEYRNQNMRGPWAYPVSISGQGTIGNQLIGNAEPFYPTRNGLFQSDFHNPFGVDRELVFGAESSMPASTENWPFLNRYQSREQSILTNFFRSQDDSVTDGVDEEDDELLMAASTAASISSSTYKDTTLIGDSDELEDVVVVAQNATLASTMDAIQEVENNRGEPISDVDSRKEENLLLEKVVALSEASRSVTTTQAVSGHLDDTMETEKYQENEAKQTADESIEDPTESKVSTPVCRSPSPEAPITPPPTLSPILLSLADLKALKHDSLSERHFPSNLTKTNQQATLSGPGSLPSSPIPPKKKGMTSSWSRDDLRIEAFRDDQNIKQQRRQTPPLAKRANETPTYRSVAVKSLAKPIASTKVSSVDFRTQVFESSLRKQDPTCRLVCAK